MAKTFDGMYYIISSHNHQESMNTKNSLVRYVFDPCSIGNDMIFGIKVNLYTPKSDSNIKKKRKILNDIRSIL
jgi:hypothetical protein